MDALPPGLPYPSLVQGLGFWTRPLAMLERCRARYGSRFTIRFPASPPFVMVSDPADIKRVFTAPPEVLHPGQGGAILEPIVGRNSVLLLDEAAHMEQRRLMLPAFHGERMERLTGLMAEATQREVASWPRGEVVALHPRMQGLTLEIILRAVFGLEPGPRMSALRELFAEMLEYGDSFVSLLPPPPEAVATRVPPFSRFRRLQAQADAEIHALIDERRSADDEGDDVLTMLLAARHSDDGSPMSAQELRDELMTLLVAGHETTATTMAWAFSQLVHNREVLSRLEDDPDDDAYVTAAVQEALRHRPVLPNVQPRYVIEPYQLADGWTAPPGICLVPNAYLVHHDPAIYPDPYAFRPERFLDDPPGTYTWIPFGGGRRRCLGASFAMVEMRIVLRTVVASCALRAGDDRAEGPRRRNITVRPDRGAAAILGERGVPSQEWVAASASSL